MRLSGRKSSYFTRRWTPRQRVALLALISANIAAFAAQLFIQNYDASLLHEFFGLSDRGVRAAYGWQFFTAAFLHDGPWDFLANLTILYFVGRDVESILSQRHFLLLYAMGAFGGELGHLFLMPSDCVLFAASGGAAAVLVAYATILPELELSALFFFLPFRVKAKHLAGLLFTVGIALIVFDRQPGIVHSAYLGGGLVGWLYVHLLGFGRPSFVQRFLSQRRSQAERLHRMGSEQFIAEQIDPLLDKISRSGIASLSRSERKILALAREKMAGETTAS